MTENAAKRVTSFIANRGKGVGVRLGVRTSGCSGMAYVLEFADEVGGDDLVFEDRGVKVIIDLAEPAERWRHLGHGYRVEPRIVLWESNDVLKVPLSSLFRQGGEWASKALKEAKLLGNAVEVATSTESKFNSIPKQFTVSPDADYLHYTTNNTIYGTEWKQTPKVGTVPLLADMSSDMFGLKRDFANHALIYAGAQKNLGPAGVAIVIVSSDGIPTRITLPPMQATSIAC